MTTVDAVEVFLGGHRQQGAADRCQRLLGVTVESRCVADISTVPCPQHGDQIVGVAAVAEEVLPEPVEEVIE